MDRILVGADGSTSGQFALEWAANLAAGSGLDLVAARVFVPTQAELPPEEFEDLHTEQLSELERWCDELSAYHPRAVLLDGDPPDALLDAAREHSADLLVVGARGTGGFAALHVGSVAHHLTHHSTLPLAVVPSTSGTKVEHFVVGVDGSPGSHAAVTLCAELASSLGASVTAVHTYDPAAEWVKTTDSGSWEEQARSETADWVRHLEKAGVNVEFDVDRDTHPVVAIGRALDAHPSSVAVLGTRGLGGFTHLRLGRVPLQLVHEVGDPVILVPPANT